MFHLIGAFDSLTGAPAANEDLAFVTDGEFTIRNSHLIMTEPYNLIYAANNILTGTSLRFNVPSINGIARHHFWPISQSATVVARPVNSDYRDYPMPLPMNEEIALEASNGAVGAENAAAMLWLAPPGWNRNLPRGVQRLTVSATAAVAGVAGVWSSEGALTFAENLKGGWYSVVGCQCFDAGTLCYRFNFPRGNIVNGRKLRPGGLCQEAIANPPSPDFFGGFGVWGKFHSFEPPTIQIIANASAASAQVLRMDLIYHGDIGG